MSTHALDTGGDMGAPTEGGMVGSAVAALAIVIPSRTTSLGTGTTFILIFMGGYSSTCPRYGSPQPPILM